MATKTRKKKAGHGGLSNAELDDLIREATVDCYSEEEELTGLETILDDELELPFQTEVLGLIVEVTRIEPRGRGIACICKAGCKKQWIDLVDLPLPEPEPEGARWIHAYRRWTEGF